MQSSFLLDQNNLQLLCKDRDLKTAEIHSSNDYYGQASILKEYANISKNYSLKCVLEHGLFFNDWVWHADQNIELPIFLSVSSKRSHIQKLKTSKKSIPVGFGFLYAIKLFKERYGQNIETIKPHGTIVFPSHSTHHITAKFDFEHYSNKLSSLPDKYHPITVCIYWRDFLLGHHCSYQNKGFQIVTCGHMYDPLFWLRFYDLCRRFKYATSNDFGTHLFLSIKSGCSFFYTNSEKITHVNPQEYELLDYSKTKEESVRYFSEPIDEISCDQMKFVNDIMGVNHFKSKEEIRTLLLYSEILDKFHIMPHSISPKLNKFPTFLQRKFIQLKSRKPHSSRNIV
jgi:hypothetical protein